MKKIALIEDNLDVRESTKEILELADYDIVTAGGGRSGLELIKKEKPDMILCDVSMPDLDGYAVLNILKKSPDTSDIPFIFLSGKSEKNDIRKGMNLGADDYITKPFDESDILEAIESRLTRKQKLEEFRAFPIQEKSSSQGKGIQELDDLLIDRKVKQYKKKDTIYRFDDFANYLYYIKKGNVKTIISDAYSKDFVVDILGEGEFLGHAALIQDGDYKETVKALEETEIVAIPKMDFLELLNRNMAVYEHFTKNLINNLRRRESRLLLLAYAPVRERLAHELLMLKDKASNQNGSEVSFVISREDLASIVGTAKESLIRTLSELKSDRLIDTDGQKITVLSETGLESLANV